MGDGHFFTSDAFLRVLADVYFPGAEPALVTCAGFTTRTLLQRGRAVTGFWKFQFYHESVLPPPSAVAKPVPFLQNAVRATTATSEAGPAGCRRSPFIRWRDFPAWEDYEAFAKAREMRSSSLVRDRSRLERALGPVRFVPNDPDPAVFEATLRWKVAHFERSGAVNRFSNTENVEFYREMNRRGLLMVSSLRAGDRVVAGQFANPSGGRFIYRLTSYDYSLREFSPGAIHLAHLLRHSYAAGDDEFDFLSGEEPYKYHYATHVRWLGPLGSEPRLDRWRRDAQTRVGRVLFRHPRINSQVRRARRVAGQALPRFTRR